jgi:DNA-binding GntR family transcriptional regulator
LLEPDFVLDRLWAARSRREHEAIMATRPDRVSMIRFFEINADFHETLAACSGNQFFHHTVQFQNKLRRFLAYSWTYGHERIMVSCREHLEILTAVEKDQREWAASLMKRHLQLAAEVTPVASEVEGNGKV